MCLYKTGEPLPRARESCQKKPIPPPSRNCGPWDAFGPYRRPGTCPTQTLLKISGFAQLALRRCFATKRTRVVEDRSASSRPYSGHTKGGDRAIRVLRLGAAESCSHGLREGSIQLKRALVSGLRSGKLGKSAHGQKAMDADVWAIVGGERRTILCCRCESFKCIMCI